MDLKTVETKGQRRHSEVRGTDIGWPLCLAAIAATWAGLALPAEAQPSATSSAPATSAISAGSGPSIRPDTSGRLVDAQREDAIRGSLLGHWKADLGKTSVNLELLAGEHFVLGSQTGRYTIVGNVLTLRTPQCEVPYTFDLSGDQLTVSGGDLTSPLKLVRVPDTPDFANWLFDISPRALERKFWRVTIIVMIVAACRLILFLLRRTSRLFIYSEWGPIKFIHRYRKNRAMTIHSLVLNVSKYVIYLLALGFILMELGVNYTAYLASVSVIGLAIAFGAQGLVQDMVTGFFIIFEGQFDVGDMVEIPPHVGIVQELGLRMTKLRNYLGQQVVIPNRNIAAVGNYRKGAQEAHLDVAAADAEAAKKAVGIVRRLVEEMRRQFEGVIVKPPVVTGPLSLATGEHFVRLNVSIWPQQQWVVEEQMVPRIRELLGKAGLPVPSDRVAVFYHAREDHSVSARYKKAAASPRE